MLASLCATGPAAVAKGSTTGCPVVLTGEVQQGQGVSRPLGGGLIFVLEPVQGGWTIRVLPAQGARPAVDYAAVVTPPFRSVNPLLLTTDWGFRAQDVVGWNPRAFHYVQNKPAYAAADRAYNTILGTPHPSAAQNAAVAHAVAESAEGRFEILDARLLPGSGDPSSAAAMLGSRFATTAHTLVTSDGGGATGRVEQIRFRATLGGSPALWGSRACKGRRE